MKTIYPTKIGFELAIPLAIIFIGTTILFVTQKLMIGLTINAFLIAFITYLFTSIQYVIDADDLTIRCGFFYNKKIAIVSIKEINKTRNPISSFAASLDRLEIVYGENSFAIISPKDKQGFIEQIILMNKNVVAKG